uniref:Uncharacterized protein n=1 Tax=Timema bartmani TaxID=61472 RepID=A0A7R9F577_9NEOP|nr:unnamed protein product [Timema bartmani]
MSSRSAAARCGLIRYLRQYRAYIDSQIKKMCCTLPAKRVSVCDSEWHHYAVSVKFPEITLYVDGQLFKAEKKNPEIIDDWPLHPTKGINTTLTVGACWQGIML